MIHTLWSLSVLLLLTLPLFACGESEPDDRPFILAESEAANLVKQGMEKEIVGDTVIAGTPVSVGDTVVSPDGSKRAWCQGRRLLVADRHHPDGVVLHDESEHGGVVACLAPTWSPDGSEISFVELLPSGEGIDSVYQVTRVIIALGAGESE